jgi:hypothetical protein
MTFDGMETRSTLLLLPGRSDSELFYPSPSRGVWRSSSHTDGGVKRSSKRGVITEKGGKWESQLEGT